MSRVQNTATSTRHANNGLLRQTFPLHFYRQEVF